MEEMEESTTIDTAAELLQFLLTIPQAVLERLPIQLAVGDELVEGSIYIQAFETTETEGEIERGFRLHGPDEDE